MKVFGKELEREQLLRYSATTESLFGMRRVVLSEGRSSGHQVIQVRTTSGFELLISVDRCLDILEASYQGIPLAFVSKNGITAREDFLPLEDAFVRYWPGGLLATCGLRNTGPACRDGAEFHPLHGRIGSTPAQGISTRLTHDGRTLVIEGTIRETALFGPSLRMKRQLRIPADGSSIEVVDTVENETPEAQEILILYHYNLGFPFLEEGCILESSAGELRPRDAASEAGLAEADTICAPIDGAPEQVFFREAKDDGSGWASATVRNHRLGLRIRVSYELAELPVLIQWKSMRSGDYALGLEPANNHVRGRVGEREMGILPTIAPFGQKVFRTRLDVLGV